ncbi:hypothetical protein A2960_03310 [Candidatus Gottesmanbacteria bacterium RIFCSPLOWO2_01_FULL_39_12b]|uniref:Uncharacterized protein n=1 Tax=Candidatus Gottesmanbacteria bacterium RIFCSPLOWO2_01_FULL_39_12b TaxID=1798388 RepID=A0A1F6APX3_9BACT|nr:MAG: hypothetical protein A2960_03310 [Candidatus Gottesmanbacteria bacterium RIFCSPLOWO2_01_FULL_39_12b]
MDILLGLAAILFFISIALFVAGLVNPRWVPLFTKGEKTRKRAAVVYGLSTIIFLTLVGIIPSQTTKSESDTVPSLSEPNIKAALPKCFKELKASTVRQTTDQPDDNSDYQVHVIYAIPSDGVDRQLDTNGTVATSVSAWQNWLCNQTNDKYFRLDTNKRLLDVTFVRLDASDEDIKTGKDLPFDTTSDSQYEYVVNGIDFRLKKLGFNDPHKLYAVYYDGTTNIKACGQAVVDGSLHTAAVYLHGILSTGKKCDTADFTTDYTKPGFYDYEMVHQIIHSLGFVPDCAPHVSKSAHSVTDSNTDIMYHGNDEPMLTEGLVLDFYRDDYYDSGLGYLDCPDLSVNAFLVGGVSQLPPKW